MSPTFTELPEIYSSCYIYRYGGVFWHFRGRSMGKPTCKMNITAYIYICKSTLSLNTDLSVICFPVLVIRDQSAPFVSDIIQWKTEIFTIWDLTIKPSMFFPQIKYTYVFCMFVGANSDYFLVRHSWLLMYITDVLCIAQYELIF
jgi:hypothetical protein